MIHRQHLAWLVLAVGLGGCAGPPPETIEEAQARRGLSCKEAGFVENSESYRLCLLLQQTDERLANVEHRLRWIEQDVRFGPPFYPGRPFWW